MKIKVVGLSSCKNCKALKENLEKFGIPYHFSDCDKDPTNCDNLESLTNTIHYPMIMISDSESNILEILYITENYEALVKGSYLKNGIKLIPLYSVDSLFRYASARLNLNT